MTSGSKATVAPIVSSPQSRNPLSPAGHTGLSLVLEVTADESGELAAEDRPRLYYDTIGFAEESVQELVGTYRVDVENGVEAPVFALDGLHFATATTQDLVGLPQLGDLSSAEFLGYGALW